MTSSETTATNTERKAGLVQEILSELNLKPAPPTPSPAPPASEPSVKEAYAHRTTSQSSGRYQRDYRPPQRVPERDYRDRRRSGHHRSPSPASSRHDYDRRERDYYDDYERQRHSDDRHYRDPSPVRRHHQPYDDSFHRPSRGRVRGQRERGRNRGGGGGGGRGRNRDYHGDHGRRGLIGVSGAYADVGLDVGEGTTARRGEQKVDVTWGVRHMFSMLKRLVYTQYLKPGGAVGDFGHGPGTDLAKFAYARVGTLIAVDFVSEALEEAAFRAKTNSRVRKVLRDVQFIAHDLARSVCRIEPAVDTITCQFALHYMWGTTQSIHTFLTSVRDSLKSKGHFILTIVDSNILPSEGILQHPYICITPPKQSVVVAAAAAAAAPTTQSASPLVPTVTAAVAAVASKPAEASAAATTATSAAPSTTAAATSAAAPASAAPSAPVAGDSGPIAPGWDDLSKRWSYHFTFPGLVNNVEEYVVPVTELISKCREFSLELVQTFTVKDKLEEIRALHPARPDLTLADWTVLNLYRCYVFQKL